jgi:alcohol dehydrogenase class IV
MRAVAATGARAGLALASLYGGYCLGPVNTTAGHAVAYPLGTRHHIAHGHSCAVIFPHTLAFNAPAAPEKTVLILDALGLGAAGREEGAVRDTALGFCAGLGIEMRLARLGVPEDDLPELAAAAASRPGNRANPRPATPEEALELLRSVW